MRILVTGGSGFIGTNLTQFLARQGIEFCNMDVAPPKDGSLSQQWINGSILDVALLNKVFQEFRPSAVIHLSAETDTDPSKKIDDYKINIEGTHNVLEAIKQARSVERVIITSTQFVNQSENGPQHDQDYAPYTIYGQSKIMTEEETRSTGLTCAWTIIRPTNIWGPWHLRYPFEFWKVLAEGKYFHPGRKKVIRSYGYVGNVVSQIMKILQLPIEQINRKVFYVGDRPIDLYDWVNGFSKSQIGRNVTVLPRFFVFSLAALGNVLRFAKIKFPITITRYRSMTTDNPIDIDKTFEVLGESPYSLEQGIAETIEWLRTTHPRLLKD
jgi:nucleoside-diphosphate-sugar epimerase